MQNTLLLGWFSRRFERWLKKMIPPSESVFLNRKNIFILPTKIGVFYIIVALVIWLLGTNYQNNLVLFVAYLLFALFIITIHQTFHNLNKLTVSFKTASPIFVGEKAEFIVHVGHERGGIKESLFLFFRPNKTAFQAAKGTIFNKSHIRFVQSDQVHAASVYMLSQQRGWLKPERLCIETVYPLGLLRCWTWLDLNAVCLVYPKPIKFPVTSLSVSDDGQDSVLHVVGGDEYNGLKNYVQGDEIKRIAWKASSKGKGLYVKEYAQNISNDVWLDLDGIQAESLEDKLSGLSYWAQYFHNKQQAFGLVLGEHRVPINHSVSHYAEVMASLATYGLKK